MATAAELIKRVKDNTLENTSKSMYEVILKQNALLTDLLRKLMSIEQPSPIIKVSPPNVTVDAPVIKVDNKSSVPDVKISPPINNNNITVEQPVNNITVEPSKPIVTIQKDDYSAIEIEIERDRFGNIEKLICTKVR